MAAEAIPIIQTYTHILSVDKIFRLGVQLSGSSGSEEGVGTRTISRLLPFACFAFIVPSRSTRWTVPGTKLASFIAGVAAIVVAAMLVGRLA